MRKTEFMTSLTRNFHKFGMQVRKHSPEILVVAGIAGTVASTVMACKATLKVNEVLEETKETIDKIHTSTEKGHNPAGEVYTEENSKKDLSIVYVQTAVKFVKLYGPAVLLGTASIAAIVKSNDILRKRNFALAAAYTVVDKGFKEYRGRVIERFGKELDRELRYDIRAEEVEKTIINEKGEEETVKETVNVAYAMPSEYSRIFDETCTSWCKNADVNKTFLLQTQNYCNDLLRTRGHVFLNEVYDRLGFDRTPIGQVVGWIYDPTSEERDSYIDFGIYDQIGIQRYDEPKRRFVNGYEKSILLDFNVDGPIWELIQ